VCIKCRKSANLIRPCECRTCVCSSCFSRTVLMDQTRQCSSCQASYSPRFIRSHVTLWRWIRSNPFFLPFVVALAAAFLVLFYASMTTVLLYLMDITSWLGEAVRWLLLGVNFLVALGLFFGLSYVLKEASRRHQTFLRKVLGMPTGPVYLGHELD